MALGDSITGARSFLFSTSFTNPRYIKLPRKFRSRPFFGYCKCRETVPNSFRTLSHVSKIRYENFVNNIVIKYAAGAVMDGLFGGPFEFRGKSWAIGGDPKQITFPNFIKRYQSYVFYLQHLFFFDDPWPLVSHTAFADSTSSVQGASRSYHVPEICLGDEFCPPGQYQPALDQLNAAQSGAWISNWPTEYQYLMEQMKANPKIDIQNDWKVLTILIGANNLCRACDPEFDIFDAADNFEDSLRQLVAKVQATIPKVFVNLVSIFNVSQVFDITEKSLECDAAHGA